MWLGGQRAQVMTYRFFCWATWALRRHCAVCPTKGRVHLDQLERIGQVVGTREHVGEAHVVGQFQVAVQGRSA